MKKKSIFKAGFEESLNLEDDGFRKLQQDQHDKTAKFFKNVHASLWFCIRSFILSLIFPVGFNFILLAISMEFHESDTLTLPIAKHESLTVNVFLLKTRAYIYDLVLIGNGSNLFRLSASKFGFLGNYWYSWFHCDDYLLDV